MLRGDNLICGTSTTGTGTLTLAATPAALGAIDLFIWLTEKFSSTDRPVHLIPYQLIEYADATFAKPISVEKGVGTITLGTTLAGTTLARTLVQRTQVIATPNYVTTSPAAFSIGTAANTLVFLGDSSDASLLCSPFFDTTATQDLTNKGATPLVAGHASGSNFLISGVGAGADVLWPFFWATPMLVKRVTFRVSIGDAGASTLYVSIHEIGSDGRPGRLLLDLGVLGTAGTSVRTVGYVSTALHASGLFLTPALYAMRVAINSITNSPAFASFPNYVLQPGGNVVNGAPRLLALAGTGAAAAPDPADLTGYGSAGVTQAPAFWLGPT